MADVETTPGEVGLDDRPPLGGADTQHAAFPAVGSP
jgi:hypothetical protein